MKIFMAQMNSTIGDFSGNLAKMHQSLKKVSASDLVVFPECCICGYPAQDLLDIPGFVERSESAVSQVIKENPDRNFILGTIEKNTSGGKPLRNAAIFVSHGKILGRYYKRLLPTYDVFDEDRFFEPGREPGIFEFNGIKLGVTICEDVWSDNSGTVLHRRYQEYPLKEMQDVDILINLSASPFESAKVAAKQKMLKSIAERYGKPFIYVNSVGANDSLIFDGRSYAFSKTGTLLKEGKSFGEDLVEVDIQDSSAVESGSLDEIRLIYDALVLGIQDYCRKQNFKNVVLGLSGGIDSSVVACLACDALGTENVMGVLMPSRFTSVESNRDAILLAKSLQNPIHILAIEELFKASLHTLEKTFEGLEPDVTEENLQARIRGLLLMAIANKFNTLVLTTGNKSELAVGYCTLYGDMCGALAPLADVYKTQVFELAREANRRGHQIPEAVFTKAPTAELRPNQTDQDILPPYVRLDQILKMILEDGRSDIEISKHGFQLEEVQQIFDWVGRNEYKRYQMPLGLKVSSKAFGIGRRIPVVNHYFFRR